MPSVGLSVQLAGTGTEVGLGVAVGAVVGVAVGEGDGVAVAVAVGVAVDVGKGVFVAVGSGVVVEVAVGAVPSGVEVGVAVETSAGVDVGVGVDAIATENDWDALPKLVPPFPSTLYEPIFEVGTTKDVTAPPVAEAIALATLVEAVTVVNHLTVIVSFAANPLRITSTLEPLLPDVGSRLRLGLTVKNAELSPLLEPPRPSILWLPLTASGTTKLPDVLPVEEAIKLATTVEVVVVSYHLTAIASFAA